MTVHATIGAESAKQAHAAWTRRLLQRQVEMLGELAEIGMRIARETGRAACGGADPAVPDDAAEIEGPDDADAEPIRVPPDLGQGRAMAFARVSRAVRLTLLLQAKVLEDLRRQALPQMPSFSPPAPQDVRKARVERIVGRIAHAALGEDAGEIRRLTSEAGERLDDEDLHRDILARPVGELVAHICRDLGLHPDWARLAREPWAEDERDDPRSPFSRMGTERPIEPSSPGRLKRAPTARRTVYVRPASLGSPGQAGR